MCQFSPKNSFKLCQDALDDKLDELVVQEPDI